MAFAASSGSLTSTGSFLRPGCLRPTPKVHRDESRTQGFDRLEAIRFLQVSQTIKVHHGALAFLFGIKALRASEAAAVRIEDYAETLRGHRVLHLVGKGNKPATMPVTVPVLRVLQACRGERTSGPLVPASAHPQAGRPSGCVPDGGPDRESRSAYLATSAHTRCGTPRITDALDAGVPLRDAQDPSPATPTREPPNTTTAPAETSTGTASTSSPATRRSLSWTWKVRCSSPAPRRPN